MSAVNTTHERQAVSLFQGEIVKRALIDSVKKLDPECRSATRSCSSWRSAL